MYEIDTIHSSGNDNRGIYEKSNQCFQSGTVKQSWSQIPPENGQLFAYNLPYRKNTTYTRDGYECTCSGYFIRMESHEFYGKFNF
jgi:hypothetical protein